MRTKAEIEEGVMKILENKHPGIQEWSYRLANLPDRHAVIKYDDVKDMILEVLGDLASFYPEENVPFAMSMGSYIDTRRDRSVQLRDAAIAASPEPEDKKTQEILHLHRLKVFDWADGKLEWHEAVPGFNPPSDKKLYTRH